jgi:hypothetical protein
MTLRRFRFSRGAEERLQLLLDKCGTNDTTEVIRNALRLYEWAVEEVESGKKIAAIDADGKAEWINIYPTT